MIHREPKAGTHIVERHAPGSGTADGNEQVIGKGILLGSLFPGEIGLYGPVIHIIIIPGILRVGIQSPVIRGFHLALFISCGNDIDSHLPLELGNGRVLHGIDGCKTGALVLVEKIDLVLRCPEDMDQVFIQDGSRLRVSLLRRNDGDAFFLRANNGRVHFLLFQGAGCEHSQYC